MYENLLDELSDRGINWVFGEVGQAGLESHDFRKSGETCEWILKTGLDIIDGLNPYDPNSYPRVEPKALLLLGQACAVMFHDCDGHLSKDLAMIAFLNAAESGHIELGEEVVANMLMANGRYIDCAIHFHNQYQDGSYDETFLPDVAEVINDMNHWCENIASEHFDWPSEMVQGECLGRSFMTLAKIIRGTFIHLEMGLRLMNNQQVSQFMQVIGPLSATFNLNYAKIASKESNVHYATGHTMMAYVTFMYRNLAGVDVPIESILDSVYKACLDDANLSPEETYYTLFAQVLRLRILSGMGVNGERWDYAVEKADQAIANSADLNCHAKLAELVDDFKTHGRIMNVEQYAEVLGRTI